MGIKTKIASLSIIKIVASIRRRNKEYNYDKKLFINNYSYSKENKNKTGYNMILISHSLEKGMSNEKPRPFGVEKTERLMSLIDRYESFENYKNDFAYIYAINTLREYVRFYNEQGWKDRPETNKVIEHLNKKSDVKSIKVGSYSLTKEEIMSQANIDYRSFVQSRHSIRDFDNDKLKEKEIKQAIETAILSPSACNRQMCKVYFIKNNSIKNKIIEMAQGFGGFKKETINILLITFDINANYFIGERNQGWFNAGLFSTNLINALHSKGIGSCFCQFGNKSEEEDEIKRIVGIPQNERIAVILSIGHYKQVNKILYSPRKNIKELYTCVE